MNLKYKHIEGFDCLDDAMSIAFEKHNLNYNLSFINSWCFNYNLKKNTIGEALDGNRGDRFEILNKIFNIEFICYTLSNQYDTYPLGDYLEVVSISKEEMVEILEKSLQDNQTEVIIQYDTFSFPWDDLYQKYHGTHMCYTNSFNGKDVELYDRWYSETKSITIEECMNNAYKFIVANFSRKQEKINSANQVIDAINNSTNFNLAKKSVEIFKDRINTLELEKEFEDCTKFDYTKSPIMRNLKETVYNKKQLSILFKDIYNRSQIDKLKKFSQMTEEISEKFELLRMYIAKEFLIDTTRYSQEIRNLSEEIASNERIILEEFSTL